MSTLPSGVLLDDRSTTSLQFKDCTTLTIAHPIHTVIDSWSNSGHGKRTGKDNYKLLSESNVKPTISMSDFFTNQLHLITMNYSQLKTNILLQKHLSNRDFHRLVGESSHSDTDPEGVTVYIPSANTESKQSDQRYCSFDHHCHNCLTSFLPMDKRPKEYTIRGPLLVLQ